jgi:hypothetical protein
MLTLLAILRPGQDEFLRFLGGKSFACCGEGKPHDPADRLHYLGCLFESLVF